MSTPSAGRVLVVDDEEVIRSLVTTHLEAQGFVCETAADGRHGLQLANTGTFDVVLTDVRMPGLDGLSLVREIHRVDPSLPVIVVSAQSSFDGAVRALKHGAYDYILKPFHLEALEAAIQRALERRRLQKENRDWQRLLDQKVEERTTRLVATHGAAERQARRLRRAAQRLRAGFEDAMTAIAHVVEVRGGETPHHGRRVRAYTLLLARRLGLPARELRDAGWGALLHDIGTIAVPDAIVAADRELEPDEREAMERHPVVGYRMLRGTDLLAGASLVVLAHHENFDGTGYPYGRRGDEIPIGARCVRVVDAVEAITSPRNWRPARPLDAALEEVQRGAGTQFDPDVAHAFLSIPRHELERVRQRWLDEVAPAAEPHAPNRPQHAPAGREA